MDLRCPNCNSSDLKSLSVAFQEGRFSLTTRSRLRGVAVGAGGPDVVIGRATTRGVQQSDLSCAQTSAVADASGHRRPDPGPEFADSRGVPSKRSSICSPSFSSLKRWSRP